MYVMRYLSILLSLLYFTIFLNGVFANTDSGIEQRTISWAPGNIEGKVYLDNNSDNLFDEGDEALEGIKLEAYEDVNRNNILDAIDEKVGEYYSSFDGSYSFELYPSEINGDRLKVNNTYDDAYIDENGNAVVTDEGQSQAVNKMALRFEKVEVPQNVTILSATIKFKAAGNFTAMGMKIFGENNDNPNPFQANENIGSRPQTDASHSWTAPSNIQSGSEFIVNGFENVIYEIIARQGWEAGNAMAFMIKDFNGEIYTFDGGYAPELTIYYADENNQSVKYIIQPSLDDIPTDFQPDAQPQNNVFLYEGNAEVSDIDFSFSNRIVLANNFNVESDLEIQVGPNPTTDYINIIADGAELSNYGLEVYSMNGSLVMLEEGFASSNQLQFDVTQLPRGIYQLVFRTEIGKYTDRIVVQ